MHTPSAATAAPRHQDRPRAFWRRPGLLLNLAFLLVFAYVLRRVGWLDLHAVATPRGVSLLTLAVGLKILTEVFGSLAWQRLARLQGIPLSWQTAVLAGLSGQYLARVTPSRVGELIRVSYLMHSSGQSVGLALSSVMAERVLSRLVSLVYQVIGAFAFVLIMSHTDRYSPWVAVGVVAAALLLSVTTAMIHLWRPLHERVLGFLGRLPFLARFRDHLREMMIHYHSGLAVFRQRSVWGAVGLEALSHPGNFLVLFAVFAAWEVPLPFYYYLPCYLLANLLSRLGRVSVMGIGTTEVLTGWFLSALNYDAAVAASAVATVAVGMYFVTHVVVPALGMGVWLRHPVPISGRRADRGG